MPIARLLPDAPMSFATREPAPLFSDPLGDGLPSTKPGPYLETQSVIRGFAALYERIRNTLDFRDEHLVRVFSIRRILKRRLVRGARADRVTGPFLRELIRGGYVPQEAVPEADLDQYVAIIEKYIQLFYHLAESHKDAFSNDTWDWIFTLAANELEATLVPAPHRLALSQRLQASCVQEKILGAWSLTEEEAGRQILIAVNRSLLKLPNELLSWHLFVHRYPRWTAGMTPEEVREVAGELERTKRAIDQDLKHGAADRLSRHIKPVATTLWLLIDTLEGTDERGDILRTPDRLKEELTKTVSAHLKATNARLRRTLWRSLLYILLTKMAIALLIEVPVDRVLTGGLQIAQLLFNILTPPFFLLVFGLSVRVPGGKNTQAILSTAERLIGEGALGLEPLRAPAVTNKAASFLFNLFYGAVYLITFGGIVWLLLRYDFTPIGVFIFVFFLSIVSFFGFRIREQAQELIVTKGEERFLVFIAALFFLPILRTGRWIAQQSSRINIFLYLMDVFIEVPLQAFLEFFDAFTGFVRQKKEDVTS